MSNSDTITIQRLRCNAIIGCNPQERFAPQPLVITAVLECDLSDACQSDSLDDTANYHDIVLALQKLAETSQFHLIERFAEDCAEICLRSPRVNAVRIRIEKPNAIPNADCASVEIRRTRREARVS